MSAILSEPVHRSCENMSDATQLLTAVEQGEPQAAEKLLDLVYEELRRLAAIKMASLAPGHTLQPTALVHEAWLRLVGDQNPTFQDRAQFLRQEILDFFPHLAPSRDRSQIALDFFPLRLAFFPRILVPINVGGITRMNDAVKNINQRSGNYEHTKNKSAGK